ncbi:hypothetical protein COCOBI_12-1120 [Coccomyxa sp. Obi]|nr:hypothetical protein COCOBI_12-1120 [Coccomyxa sp. Obi]
MVQADLLSYRPKSRWAYDLPAEVHGPLGEVVITAPTPGHLYCMARLDKCGSLLSTDKEEWLCI